MFLSTWGRDSHHSRRAVVAGGWSVGLLCMQCLIHCKYSSEDATPWSILATLSGLSGLKREYICLGVGEKVDQRI